MRIYIGASPEASQEARRYSGNLAHAAYRIGEGSVLLRQSLLLETKGGLLTVSDRDAPFIDSPEALRDGVLRECGRRGYHGVLLDFEEAPRRDRRAFAAVLAPALSGTRRALYLPERYADMVPGGVALLCTAVSGGSFTQYLQEAVNRAGRRGTSGVGRAAVTDGLPSSCAEREGEPLTGEAFKALMEREQPAVFFSQDLCARYFTYSRDGEVHFVLFDDADTLNRKLRVGTGMGFAAAFLMWPEISDIASGLRFPKEA